MKKISDLLFLFTVGVITLIVYNNHFNNSFHFDDFHTIKNNLYIRKINNIPLFFKDATTMSTLPSNQSYRPLLTTTTAIDFYISGKETPEPFVFHITNFLIFLLSGFLLYYFFLHILQKSLATGLNRYLSFFGTAWFLLHAANAETVNYIIARSDLMSVFFILAGFVAYFYSSLCRKYYLYLVPVLAGLLTKEHTIMFMPILFFYCLLFEQQTDSLHPVKQKEKIMAAIKTVALPFLITILVFLFVRTMTSHTWTPGGTNRWKYIFTQPSVIFHYWYNFLLPANLVADTDWALIKNYTDDQVFAGLLFMGALLISFIISIKKQSTRPVAFGLAWFLLSLAPTSLMPFAEVLNDHRTFFAYIGLFIAAISLIRNFLNATNILSKASAKWAILTTGIIFLSLHAIATRQRNEVWKTEKSLWKENTVKAPANGRGWMNYGVSLMAEGDFAGAETCFTKTTQLWPAYPFAYINLGIVKQHTGLPSEAEAYFQKALSMDARVPTFYEFYADMLLEQGRLTEADSLIKKGLQLSPNLEGLLNVQRRCQAALKSPQANTASQPPAAATWLNKSLEYYNAGNYRKCIEAAETALQLKPDYDLAYNNICAAYNRMQQYDKAIIAGEKGLSINPNNQLLKGNLAEAHKLKGQ